MGRFDFESVDHRRFPCVELAEAAAKGAESLSISLNAANEIAVDAFLRELIRFTDIPIIIDQVLNRTSGVTISTIADIIAQDLEARAKALESMKRCTRS